MRRRSLLLGSLTAPLAASSFWPSAHAATKPLKIGFIYPAPSPTSAGPSSTNLAASWSIFATSFGFMESTFKVAKDPRA